MKVLKRKGEELLWDSTDYPLVLKIEVYFNLERSSGEILSNPYMKDEVELVSLQFENLLVEHSIKSQPHLLPCAAVKSLRHSNKLV